MAWIWQFSLVSSWMVESNEEFRVINLEFDVKNCDKTASFKN
jgi:hypothetical protein